MQKRTLKRTKTNFGSDKSENEPLPKRTLANKEAKIGLYKNESWSEIKAKSARWKAKIGGGGTVLANHSNKMKRLLSMISLWITFVYYYTK